MKDAAYLNVLAMALFALAAMSFTRQRRLVLVCSGALFVVVATWTTLGVWWANSPAVAVCMLAVLMGLPLLALLAFAVDTVWAPFCLEMTWPAMICWLLWPALVVLNAAGLVFRLFRG